MELSILIPARNEEFLSQTVADILKNIRAETEVIVVLDGAWPVVGLPQHERLNVVYHPVSIGQRAATNEAARLARGKYLMKVDAHCAFDEGFDQKLLSVMQPNYTLAPLMRNLHVFDWVCPNGHRRYQSPSGVCTECGQPTEKEIVWHAKESPRSTSYCFDRTMHFQYFGEFKNRPEGQGELTESMSLQGSCFMLSKEKYWELNICDEEFGSWGQQGVEVATKTWLSGGRVMVYHNTWYAHMFRTQGGDFGFPYPNPEEKVTKARQRSRWALWNNKLPKQKYPFTWLLKKFAPVPGWEVSKGIIYYTDNQLAPDINEAVQKQLVRAAGELPIVSVGLKPEPMPGKNIVLPLERGYLTMFKQILVGLEALNTDVVFFCEHDVLYHPSHFEFTPPNDDTYYYNVNVWKTLWKSGKAVKVDDCRQTSGLCANRKLLIKHYKERIRRVEAEGFSRKMGFEPGTHNRTERIDDNKSQTWCSEVTNVDIRHDKNLTPSRWKKEQFRDQRYTKGWQETESIPGWEGLNN